MTPPTNFGLDAVDAATIDGDSVSAVTMDAEQVFGGAIPDSGVSRWTFDNSDTSSGQALDSWGNNDGAINGATTGVAGIAGYDNGEAYDFDGGGDNVDWTTKIVPDGAKSVAFWFDADTVSQTQALANNGNIALTDDGFGFFIGGANSDLTWRQTSAGSEIWAVSTGVSTGVVHAVGVWDGTTDSGGAKLYIDGSEVGTATSSTASPDAADFDLRVGERNDGSDYRFDGVIDDVRVYNSALSPTEVSDLYNKGSI